MYACIHNDVLNSFFLKMSINSEIDVLDRVCLTKMTNNAIHEKGQYFTTDEGLQKNVFDLIQNKSTCILEPCVGKGHLVHYIMSHSTDYTFDMFEIDDSLHMICDVDASRVRYGDFLSNVVERKYDTIVGNPPFVKTKTGNLYHEFILKCFHLLNDNGELIFIVPSDFLKLTSSRNLLTEMLETGTFTHIIHPDKEDLFEHANVDVIVFRYCKNVALPPKVLVNGCAKFLVNVNGVVTFSDVKKRSLVPLGDDFDIYVGMVSGKESVFKNPELGGVEILNGNGMVEKYIMVDNFPTENDKLDAYLLEHKSELMARKIRKFHENNWFQWGALRNIEVVRARMGEPCIYVKTLTRATEVCFVGKVQLCGGGLVMMVPKKKMNLNKLVAKLNSEGFRENYLYSGRFKIGHNQLCNAVV